MLLLSPWQLLAVLPLLPLRLLLLLQPGCSTCCSACGCCCCCFRSSRAWPRCCHCQLLSLRLLLSLSVRLLQLDQVACGWFVLGL